MSEEGQNGMTCSQFEGLLSDALDGMLSGEMESAFRAHAGGCPACGPIFAEAGQGMRLLRSLEDVELPANLVHNILAATSASETRIAPVKAQGTGISWAARLWTPVRGVLALGLRPRFATSFSMAFFSLSLTLTVAGIKLKDIGHVDWHPSSLGKAVVMQYTQVESKVVRYYNNMRLVYEIESRVGQFKKNSETERNNEQPEPPKPEKQKKNNDTSGRPEQRQDNYSQDAYQAVIAYLKTKHQGA